MKRAGTQTCGDNGGRIRYVFFFFKCPPLPSVPAARSSPPSLDSSSSVRVFFLPVFFLPVLLKTHRSFQALSLFRPCPFSGPISIASRGNQGRCGTKLSHGGLVGRAVFCRQARRGDRQIELASHPRSQHFTYKVQHPSAPCSTEEKQTHGCDEGLPGGHPGRHSHPHAVRHSWRWNLRPKHVRAHPRGRPLEVLENRR